MLRINIGLPHSRKERLFVDYLFFSWRDWTSRRVVGLTEVRRLQVAEESLETELCLSTQPVHLFGGIISRMSKLFLLNKQTEDQLPLNV